MKHVWRYWARISDPFPDCNVAVPLPAERGETSAINGVGENEYEG
jgi:hypothetical protein